MTGKDVAELIKKGGILYDVYGESLQDLYNYILKTIQLPAEYDKRIIETELLERENVLSTAVGNGVAIPHPRKPLMKNEGDQRVVVAFLRNPIDMKAPDERAVYVLFFLFSQNAQFHLQMLSSLAKLIQNLEFRKFLEEVPSADALLERIENIKL